VRGASALAAWLAGAGREVSAAVVWEPVLDGDSPPAPSRRVVAARNYWDAARAISAALRQSGADPACLAVGDATVDVAWDVVFLYGPDARWDAAPPPPLACGRPIVRALDAVAGR
jgi:hypothetical protein